MSAGSMKAGTTDFGGAEDEDGRGNAARTSSIHPLPPGVIHGGEHGNIGVEPNQQRRGLVVMFDDQRGALSSRA